jgi:imidazoleglycerol-phosphate dehydratase
MSEYDLFYNKLYYLNIKDFKFLEKKTVAIDFGGRSALEFRAKFKRRMAGDLDIDLIEEFFSGFSKGLSANVAVYVPYGKNDHHKLESIFKAFGKALSMACSKNERLKDYIPSTKGIIDKL